MFWYSLLAVVAVLFLLSVTLPVPRRVWAFFIYSSKYFWLWIAGVLGLRKLVMSLTGRGDNYQPLTRPMLLRMWCEDMGPTFIKFGQIAARGRRSRRSRSWASRIRACATTDPSASTDARS